MTILRDLPTRTIDTGGKLTVKSALNPLLWFCAVVSFPTLIVLTVLINNPIVPQWLIIGLFCLVALPIICTIFSAIYLLFYDRDKLQSEDYQIRKRSLELIGQKGEPDKFLVESAPAISKPLLLSIKNKKKRN